MADNLLQKASILLTPTAYNDGDMLSVKPENGDGDFTFSRGGNGSRINSSGNIVTESANIPRIDYTDGCGSWLLEPQSTNLYLNSDTLVTQSNATSASTYTVSFYGTGTITFSGTHTGTLVGTGANDRVSATFTATSGTLTSTISGTCEKGQLENLPYATSYIPTNGSIATRLADEATNSGNSTLINSTEGVLYAEIATLANGGDNRQISISDGTNNNLVSIRLDFSATSITSFIRGNGGSYAIKTITGITKVNNNKIALVWNATNLRIWVNGVESGSVAVNDLPIGLSVFNFSSAALNSDFFYGKAKALAVFREEPTDEQLQSLTTI